MGKSFLVKPPQRRERGIRIGKGLKISKLVLRSTISHLMELYALIHLLMQGFA